MRGTFRRAGFVLRMYLRLQPRLFGCNTESRA
jgi:hypothetical protein